VKIRSEFSAQPSSSRPNPFVKKAISFIENQSHVETRQQTCADQRCGKLRHQRILSKLFAKTIFIDTDEQVNRTQQIWGIGRTSVRDFVKRLNLNDHRSSVMSSEEFEHTKLGLDVIFNVCVLDVVVPEVRKRILAAAHRNLKIGGFFVLIAPRNDQTITVRCNRANRFRDGYFFQHHSVSTFYKNFRKTTELARLLKPVGFGILEDLSVYRQVCLICRKRNTTYQWRANGEPW
jgi:hypothetical protein